MNREFMICRMVVRVTLIGFYIGIAAMMLYMASMVGV